MPLTLYYCNYTLREIRCSSGVIWMVNGFRSSLNLSLTLVGKCSILRFSIEPKEPYKTVDLFLNASPEKTSWV